MNQRPTRPTKRPSKYIDYSLSEKLDMEEHPKIINEMSKSFKKSKIDLSSKSDQKSVKPRHEGKNPFQCRNCDKTYPTKGNITRPVAKVHKNEFDLADSNTKLTTTVKNSRLEELIFCQDIFEKHCDIIDESDLKSIEAKQVNLEKNPKITNDCKKSKSTALGQDLIIIEYEESELRLIICQSAIGVLLYLIILAIIISIAILTTEFNPRVVTPKITNHNQFGK